VTDDPKKAGGRPAKAPEDKLQVVPVRLNAAQKATLQAIGQQALRDWLDKQGKTLSAAKK
jgi:hypothetical protein